MTKALPRLQQNFSYSDCSILFDITDMIYLKYFLALIDECHYGIAPEMQPLFSYKNQYKYMLAKSPLAFSGFTPTIIDHVGDAYLVQNW